LLCTYFAALRQNTYLFVTFLGGLSRLKMLCVAVMYFAALRQNTYLFITFLGGLSRLKMLCAAAKYMLVCNIFRRRQPPKSVAI
jgi:hypothetical protein